MQTFILTRGEYSDYGIMDLISREKPLLTSEVEEMKKDYREIYEDRKFPRFGGKEAALGYGYHSPEYREKYEEYWKEKDKFRDKQVEDWKNILIHKYGFVVHEGAYEIRIDGSEA